MQDDDEKKAETVRRVRSLLMLAAKKGRTHNETPKDRMKKETEFFKRMFIACDRNNDGSLDIPEVMGMARQHLKIAKRLVSDDQIKDFFNAIDEDNGGQIEFTEFLSFIRRKDENTRVKDIILTQVKRVVRLAMHKKRMTMAELEYRFAHAKDEGILDGGADLVLGPEEMRRFFRKVLDVSTHEAPDRNLKIAFKAMDEDGGGTLDADEFMGWMKEAINEETTLCPLYEKQSDNRIVPEVMGGMAGALPERLPKGRPGTTFHGGASTAPFCFSGRDLEPRQRIHMHVPLCIKEAVPHRTMFRSKASMLEPDGLLKPALALPPMVRRSASMGHLSIASDALSGGGSVTLPPLSPSGCRGSADDEDSGRQRGLYSPVRGMLGKRDADMLNRIESRLYDAGVDVRGQYHKHH